MRAPLFISHGAPDVLIRSTPAHSALRALGHDDPPAAYVVISAHWQSGNLQIASSSQPKTIHDFGNFGAELDTFHYPAPGSPALAAEIQEQLATHNITAAFNDRRGYDHGAWVPLALMRPQADIPVVQVSLPRLSDQACLDLGRALAPLTQHGIQLIGSGALTHSLADSLPMPEDAAEAGFAREFRDSIRPALAAADIQAVLRWRDLPHADRNHPTPEHFRPLLFALGASTGKGGRCLHTSWSRSALAMDIWEFD